MKVRDPKTFAAAITKVRAALSDDECARVINRSASLVRKWADPDHHSLPSLAHALALDVAYVRAGHGDPPILDIYRTMFDDLVAERRTSLADILFSALSVQGIVGDLSEAIREAVDPGGPGGGSITPRERALILELLDRLEDQSDAIEDAVDLDRSGETPS